MASYIPFLFTGRAGSNGRSEPEHGWLAAHAKLVVDSNYNQIAARNQAAEVDDE
jgi:hypothetical protein